MNALHELQNEFIDYLLDSQNLDIVDRIESTPQRSAAQRVALYGDAYQLRLKEALATDYERLHAYLGDALFDEVMNRYIHDYPSHVTSLRDYGQHMVQLLTVMPEFTSHPEVVELAKIEQAFVRSFDASDCRAATIEQLSTFKPDDWPELSFEFNASVQLLPLEFNSFPIWRALSNEQTPPAAESDPTSWLIFRRERVTHFRALQEGELAALTQALKAGSFSDLCVTLLGYFDEQNTPLQAVSYIKQWLSDQMICSIRG